MTTAIDLPQARRILRALKATLDGITAKDPEQEVQGIALPAVDAALSAIRGLLPNSPVLSQIDDLISPAMIEGGETVRAVDVLLVVNIMFAALPREASPGPAVWSPDRPDPFRF
jgi:hypothetical protein